uniref:Phosphoenolpyruvate carboxylase n=1 Tax=Angiostrongylus cantonensis TaxID=6313 RepID=A0A0K0DI45_ANGCA
MPPAYGGVPSMQLPPILPPVHPMMLPLVPVWLEHLAGRTRYLPPGCPPIPPLLRLLFNTVKLFIIVVHLYHRKPPGMPSGRTIEDLAFDQFAGYMSCKEREWLVKIQVLQCQGTGLPYDDDYYYTHWREKQIARSLKSKLVNSGPNVSIEEPRKHELRLRRVNGSRTQFDIAKEPKELVPLNVKFAGSLGLPSRSSASNPRHVRIVCKHISLLGI